MFERAGKFIENRIAPPLVAVSENPYLTAIRDGLTAVMPFFIAGSIFLLIAFFPSAAWENIVGPYQDLILDPFRLTMGVVSMYLAFAVGFSLAKIRDVKPLTGGLLSVMAFFLVAAPMVEGQINAGYLAAPGIFTAILTSILAIEVTRLLNKRNVVIRMPEGVPPAVASAFESLVPIFVLILITWGVHSLAKIDVPGLVIKAFAPLIVAADSVIAPAVMSVVEMALWFVGIHGASVIEVGVLNPFLLANLGANQAARMAGQAMPHIFVPPFSDFFLTIGGCGAMLAVPFVLMTCKSKRLRRLGPLTLVPALFGINEPILFGLPMILNPLFLLPMLVAQALNGVIAYLLTQVGLVGRMFIALPWSTPAPVGAYLATGGDFRAAILSVLLALLAAAIYLPFIRIYDRKLVEQERATQTEAAAGATARVTA